MSRARFTMIRAGITIQTKHFVKAADSVISTS